LRIDNGRRMNAHEFVVATSSFTRVLAYRTFSSPSSSSSSRGGWVSLPGIRYLSSVHPPRSMSWQRSEQNGRWGLFSHSVSRWQVGHLTRRDIPSSLAIQGGGSEKVCHFELVLHEALVKRIADETLQVGPVFLYAVWPGIAAKPDFSFSKTF